jgi:hypothetical protein
MKPLALCLALAISALLCPVPPAIAQPLDIATIRDRVEAEFSTAIQRIAYGECWALYRSAAASSKQSYSEERFQYLFDRRLSGPVSGTPYTVTEVRVISSTLAVVHARVRIVTKRAGNMLREEAMAFPFHYEDGDWRPDLSPIIGLISW